MKRTILLFILVGLVLLINYSQAQAFFYTVQKGDTFSEICSGVFSTGKRAVWEREAKRLGIKNSHVILPGKTLHFDKVYAAQKKNVRKAISLLSSHAKKNANKQEGFVYKEGYFKCSYDFNGKHYIVSYDSKVDSGGWLSFLVGPSGIYGKDFNEFFESFSDYGIDGNPEFGIKGGCGESKYFDMTTTHSVDIGKKYEEYWRFSYNRAVADAIKRLR